MEGLRTIKGRKHKSLEISQTLGMCLFGGSRAVSPLSISGISEVRANTSSELRAAPGMPRDVADLARTADETQPKALLAPLSGRGNDMLASEPASWQRQEQSPEPDRAHRRPVALSPEALFGEAEPPQRVADRLRDLGAASCFTSTARPL
jgi:hypothetical protein